MLGGFDLNLVPALNALLEERNVTRAARRLNLGQPALSAALARLRRHFDDPLLVREGQSYQLSSLAESLVEPVRDAMQSLDFAVAASRGFDPARDSRTFTIAASDYVLLVFMRPLLADLAEQAPGVRLRLLPIHTRMAHDLRRGALDMVLLPAELGVDLRTFCQQALFEDDFVLLADRDNCALSSFADLRATPEGSQPQLTLADVVDLPFVAVDGEMPPLVDQRLREQGVELRVDATTETFVVAPLLVVGTPLVSVVQRRLALLLARRYELKLLTFPAPAGLITETMTWTQANDDDAAHRWLRERILAQAQRME